jgi:hypothetical protein
MDRSHLTRGFLVLPTAIKETASSKSEALHSDREMTSQMGTNPRAVVRFGRGLRAFWEALRHDHEWPENRDAVQICQFPECHETRVVGTEQGDFS